MPGFFKPMAATLAAHPPEGPAWIFEVKWDGVRALCYVNDGKLEIFSRNANRCERQYPELSVLPHYVDARQAIIDAEIAVLDEHGLSNFGLIQPRITNHDANAVAHLARKQPATLYAFDLLYLDGYDLRKAALGERKRLLEAVLKPSERIRYSGHFENQGEDMLTAARQTGLEGLLAKCLTSTYESRRSTNWLKLKLVSEQEFVICGYTEGEREYFGSLILGLYEGGKLIHAGNVGTGFDNKKLQSVYERLQPLVVSRSPFPDRPRIPHAVWVKPEVVCEVKFASWTHDDHLRAPVFVGLRFDVEPTECARERPVEVTQGEPEEPARARKRSAAPKAVRGKAKPPVRSAPLLPGKEEEATVTVDGRPIKLSHLSKVFYPEEGYTKRDLLNFYDAVSPFILPHLKDRPLSLKRYPSGIKEEFFFQKNVTPNFPEWLCIEPIQGSERTIRYVVAQNKASLIYLTNLGCIDQNPWMSRVDTLENPDFVLIDLDPQEGCTYDQIVDAARLVKAKLDALGLQGYPKTTGGEGMHIYIPVEPVYTYEHTRTFAELIARLVIAEKPSLFTTPRPVAKREKGKVYFDYLQNGEGKTIAAPYVARAFPKAPVATPLAWSEVKPGLHPSQFTIRNAMARFERLGDLFAGVLEKPQRMEAALERLGKLVNG